MKLGMNWEERILRLHWMVHAVVHIQHFINKSNVKYQPAGPWGNLPRGCSGQTTVIGAAPFDQLAKREMIQNACIMGLGTL